MPILETLAPAHDAANVRERVRSEVCESEVYKDLGEGSGSERRPRVRGLIMPRTFADSCVTPVYTTRTPPRTVGPMWLAVASRAICLKYEDLPLLATLRNAFPRIVAPKVAGSSPVGHPA